MHYKCMTLITQQDFKTLAQDQKSTCVSIFLPTHRAGEEVVQNKDALVLKNLIKKAQEQLSSQDVSESEAKAILGPAEKLLADAGFWSHLSDGLAIFLTKDSMKHFVLPVAFEAHVEVANAFYLKPLMPMFSGDGRFFILALELENVRFYEGTRHTIADVIIDDLTPARLQEVVGYDFEQKNLQFRSQKTASGKEAVFHGQGAGQADEKNEILRYFRAIDKGLMKMLHDEYPPMVVVALDHLFSIYKEANTYPHMMDRNVSKNPGDMDKMMLHELAWEIVKPKFHAERQKKAEKFQELHGTGKASADISEIVPAASDGKIDALFLRNRTDIRGSYDAKNRAVHIAPESDQSQGSLMNLAAVQTFLQGGKVFLVEEDDMPAPFAKVNAVLRY